MTPEAIHQIEIDLLQEAIFRRYGHDFRQYAKQSLIRQIDRALLKSHCNSIGELTSKVIHDPALFGWLRQQLMLHTTNFFRTPAYFKILAETIFQYLSTHPYLDIWCAGCSTGEEVYSLAITLDKCGLLDRTRLFATDYSETALAAAKQGVYRLSTIKKAMNNYNESGLGGSFSDYIHVDHEHGIISSHLREKITFASHNLVTDTCFGHMHLISCRNVLIYFEPKLQQRVFSMLDTSLIANGFLCLGSSESLHGSGIADRYKATDHSRRVYQKKEDAIH